MMIKKRIGDILLLVPASLLVLLPNTIEGSYNVKLLDYDFFVFLFLGVVALIFKKQDKNKSKGNYLLLILGIIAFFSSVLNSDDFIFAHFAIGVEFIVGYLFAERISYDDVLLKYIKILSFVLLALVLIQQISFAFGLDYFTTGQEIQVEMADGIIRAGTTVGGSTYTGIFIPLLVGIIVTLTKNPYITFIIIIAGFFSAIISGTRSAMILMGVVGAVSFFQNRSKVPLIFRFIIIATFLIYLFPLMQGIIESRNESTSDDLTSGRVERWQYVIKYMNKDFTRYLIGCGGGTIPISSFNKEVRALASPHNVYFGILFEFGLVALLLFLLFIIKKIKKFRYYLTIGAIVLIGSMLVCWNSEVVPLAFQYSFFFWLLFFVEYTQQNKLQIHKP